MRSYFDLTPRGKISRCRKAISILSMLNDCDMNKAWEMLYDIEDNYYISEAEYLIDDLRKELVHKGKYSLMYEQACDLLH